MIESSSQDSLPVTPCKSNAPEDTKGSETKPTVQSSLSKNQTSKPEETNFMPVGDSDMLILDSSSGTETKLEDQNETKPEPVQAETKTNNSKTPRKTTYTKYKKG